MTTAIEPHLRPESEKAELRLGLELLSLKLCQTQPYILTALKESGLTVVPLATPSPETGAAAVPRPLDKAAEWARMSGVDPRDPGPTPEPGEPRQCPSWCFGADKYGRHAPGCPCPRTAPEPVTSVNELPCKNCGFRRLDHFGSVEHSVCPGGGVFAPWEWPASVIPGPAPEPVKPPPRLPGQFFEVRPENIVTSQPPGSVEVLPGVFLSPARTPAAGTAPKGETP